MSTDVQLTDPPFHLAGIYAPVADEITSGELPVDGSIPRELSGRYFRNGPNPRSGWSAHPFLGDGMIHGVRLHQGRAGWYRNRWVRTPLWQGQESEEGDGAVDRTGGVANTHVVTHAGRILALVENAYPTEITRELDTIGPYDFAGRLATAMTAHPHVCPQTGEMHFFGYGLTPPFLTYHRADATGQLVHSQAIDVPGPAMIHDFAITGRYVVFLDLPVVFDLQLAMTGNQMPFRWSDSYGARVGLMARDHPAGQVRWFDVEPCYVFHVLNAVDQPDGAVAVDVCRYRELWRAGPDDWTSPNLHRWTLDPTTGRVREAVLDERAWEFPRVDDRRTGQGYRHGYLVEDVGTQGADPPQARLVKTDLSTGRCEFSQLGPGTVAGEGVFVPAAAGRNDDEGWILSYVYDRARGSSDLVILDADDFSGPPQAVIHLPRRVPYGFHGNWISDND